MVYKGSLMGKHFRRRFQDGLSFSLINNCLYNITVIKKIHVTG